MGCDGGSIPTRVELVKLKKKEEVADPAEAERIRWNFCALTKEPLTPPIVCDRIGNLFLKESVLVRLLDKSLPPEFAHIKSLKDVQPVNFTPNPAWEEKTVQTFITSGNGVAPFICSITGLEVNGHYSFSVLKRCGCVFSDRALKEVPSAECLQCREPYGPEDIQPLNPKSEVKEQLQQALALEAAKLKEERKEKAKTKREKKVKEPSDRKRKAKSSKIPEGATGEKEKSSKKTDRPRSKKIKVDEKAEAQNDSESARCSAAYRSIFLSSTTERKVPTFTHYA